MTWTSSLPFACPYLYIHRKKDMSNQFHDQQTLEEAAQDLGKRAMALGLIPSFVIHFFPDSWVFYIADEQQSKPLTPEEAYLHLQKLLKT